MRRLLLVGWFAVALCALGTRASAMVEYCPARVDGRLHQVGAAASTLYGYSLAADGARSVSGTIVAYTPGGWFTFSFPSVVIAERAERFDTGQVKFTRRTFLSPRMYVRFPSGAQPIDAFVASATATQDPVSAWPQKGTVPCDAHAGFSLKPHQPPASLPVSALRSLDPIDEDAPPGPDSVRSVAAITSIPGSLDCAEPFAEARTTNVSVPEFPRAMVRQFSGHTETIVSVDIGPDGALLGAEVWVPSIDPSFDQFAVLAAERSKYHGGTAFCRPAPGRYLFHSEFSSF